MAGKHVGKKCLFSAPKQRAASCRRRQQRAAPDRPPAAPALMFERSRVGLKCPDVFVLGGKLQTGDRRHETGQGTAVTVRTDDEMLPGVLSLLLVHVVVLLLRGNKQKKFRTLSLYRILQKT